MGSLQIMRRVYPEPNYLLRAVLVPCARILPEAITIIRSLKQSASSILCVVIIIDACDFRLRMMFQVSLRTLGSIPVVGSSRIIRSGLPKRLIARETRRFMPPENVLILPLRLASNCTCLKLWLISYSKF